MNKLFSRVVNSYSIHQLQRYWIFFGERHLNDCQLKFFGNAYFQVIDNLWKTITVYDDYAQDFLKRLPLAHTPNLTFHVFKNGYMTTLKGTDELDIYAPDGRFVARLRRNIIWCGDLSAYVFANDGNYYLADVADKEKVTLLGKSEQILFAEQNVDGLVSVRRYRNGHIGDYADLYNTNMERITPVPKADKILFFPNGSFIVRADNMHYLYNARMERLLEGRFEMKIVDDCFCAMRKMLYDSTDGSVIDIDCKPVYTKYGKLIFQNQQLLTEDGESILGYCPQFPSVIANRLLHLRVMGRDLLFDCRMSKTQTLETIRGLLSQHNEPDDISQNLFDYIQLLDICVEGNTKIRKQMLKMFLSF
ncbi:MAG: hypothetical protein NC218_04690 [Acetobacter sp.]|nr:hypothetical protein [Acetobacter sp.]